MFEGTAPDTSASPSDPPENAAPIEADGQDAPSMEDPSASDPPENA